MRILIYGINYAPELVGIGKYTSEMTEWLVQQGHEVKVITAPPYYPYWRVQKPYRAWVYRRERIKGVDVIRCPLWVPGCPSGMKRLFHLFSFSFFSFPVLLWSVRWQPDVVITIEPSFLTVLLGGMVSSFWGIKSWLHIQDFELDAAFSLGILSNRKLSRWVSVLERSTMRRFDRVSSISGAMVERLHKKGVEAGKSRLFLNWVDTVNIRPLHEPASLREEWSIPKTSKVVLYSGNMGQKQGLDVVPKLAKELIGRRPEILFLMVGDGAVRQELEKVAERENLHNMRFLPLQPLEKLSALLAIAEVHLVLQRRGIADLVMPSKLSAILSAGGVPLVTADPGTELFKVVHDSQLGIVVKPESPESILQGLLLLLDNSELCRTFQKRAREYAERELKKEKILKQFESQLFDLIK